MRIFRKFFILYPILRKCVPGYKRLPLLFQKAIAVILLFTTILTTGAIPYLFSPIFKPKVEAVWFDDNWAFRKALTFTHNAAVSNTKVKFDIDTTAAPDSFQADCGDVRFTDANGNLLRYFLDAGVGACDTVSTDFYVLIPSIVNGENLLYMYYGNPAAPDGTEAANFSEATTTPSGGAPAAGSEAKAPSPTLYWKLDDATGTTAQDSTINNLDGTLNNTPTWQAEDMCVAGKCLWFDGTNNENVSKADNGNLDFVAADNFTIQAWVKRNGSSSANNFIITKAQTGYTGYKLYQDASGDYCFDVSDGTNTDSACTSAVDFDDDKWHQVVGVKAGTTSITLFVDGRERAQDATIAATGTLANTGTFYAGVDLDGIPNEWLGFIDEVKVYRDNSARTAAQVREVWKVREVRGRERINHGMSTY